VTALEDFSPDDAFGLLERAITYALGTVQAVTPDLLAAPTPCRDWDLGTLLHHVNESLDVLSGCLATAVPAPDAPPTVDPARAFRARATRLIGALSRRHRTRQVVIACGYPLAMSTVTATGALEVAVHGWDVSRATHEARPLPSGLAHDLLWMCPLLVVDACHHRLFAPPVAIPATAPTGDRLVAALGRDPRVLPLHR
jgi:uncharacterized protein (TIGR03086 family)